MDDLLGPARRTLAPPDQRRGRIALTTSGAGAGANYLEYGYKFFANHIEINLKWA
jgi:hypothetical protein